MKKHTYINYAVFTLTAIAITLAGTSCKSTFQERTVKPSGFLENTEQLREGKSNEAKLIYIDESVDVKKYKKIMMEPVKAYVISEESDLGQLKKEDQKKLLNYFDAALRREIGKTYTFTDQPGADVLTLRVAMTEAKGANVVMDTISSVIPIGLAVSAVKAIATGKHLSVGDIGAECEVLDSTTNKRVMAAIDARAGRKYTLRFDKFSKWRTAEDAFDYWAQRVAERINGLDPSKEKNRMFAFNDVTHSG